MARVIEGVIYKITYSSCWHIYIECTSKKDLFQYVANETMNGQIVTSVNEICKDGTTPKVKVLTDKEFRKIFNDVQKKKN